MSAAGILYALSVAIVVVAIVTIRILARSHAFDDVASLRRPGPSASDSGPAPRIDS